MGYISVHLPDAMEEFMFKLVEDGKFRSNTEVVLAALNSLAGEFEAGHRAEFIHAIDKTRRKRREPEDPIVTMLKNANTAAGRIRP